jgi:hypothetical protein
MLFSPKVTVTLGLLADSACSLSGLLIFLLGAGERGGEEEGEEAPRDRKGEMR